MSCIGTQNQEGAKIMQSGSIDELVVWLYIMAAFVGFAIVAAITILVVCFLIYLVKGVHVKDWIEEKFPS
jgi:hypothetical protein